MRDEGERTRRERRSVPSTDANPILEGVLGAHFFGGRDVHGSWY